MKTKLNASEVLFNKLNDYFKHKIRISLICYDQSPKYYVMT
jgi:hypothetical protein